MKLLVDVNLSPDWCSWFGAAGWEAVHWSEVGLPTATDAEVMACARRSEYVVFSYDLDFGGPVCRPVAMAAPPKRA